MISLKNIATVCLGSLLLALTCSLVTPDRTQLPRFWFLENSTVFVQDSAFYIQQGEGAEPVQLMEWMIGVFNDNPTVIMEVQGHADSNEREPNGLGLSRATVIKDSLVAHGIAPGRIVTTSKGAQEPLIDRTTIDRMKTKVERALARQENRRVDMKFVAWDWKP